MKSLALVPVMATLEIVRAALPVLVSVTVCGELEVPTVWLLKATLVGDRLTTGAPLAPVPARLSDWGLPGALSVTESAAVRLPAAEGLNVTLMVQLPPADTELPQVLV